MRHPHHASFRIPQAFVALRNYLLEDREGWEDVPDLAWRKLKDFLCGDLDPFLLDPGQATGDPNPELGYLNQPLEIVPFCRNGGDGLHYGWAVLAPELDLDDQVCVSFAPVDESARWLGDGTKQALENLLVGCVAGWTEWHRPRGAPSPVADPGWQALCAALDLRPVPGLPDITPGARSSRMIRPVVPPGWRYEPSDDGIGVLAAASAFAPEPVTLDDWWDRDERVDRARRLVAAGYPASALDVLKTEFPESAEVRVMRDAYQALGRDLHCERADSWLGRHDSG